MDKLECFSLKFTAAMKARAWPSGAVFGGLIARPKSYNSCLYGTVTLECGLESYNPSGWQASYVLPDICGWG